MSGSKSLPEAVNEFAAAHIGHELALYELAAFVVEWCAEHIYTEDDGARWLGDRADDLRMAQRAAEGGGND